MLENYGEQMGYNYKIIFESGYGYTMGIQWCHV